MSQLLHKRRDDDDEAHNQADRYFLLKRISSAVAYHATNYPLPHVSFCPFIILFYFFFPLFFLMYALVDTGGITSGNLHASNHKQIKTTINRTIFYVYTLFTLSSFNRFLSLNWYWDNSACLHLWIGIRSFNESERIYFSISRYNLSLLKIMFRNVSIKLSWSLQIFFPSNLHYYCLLTLGKCHAENFQEEIS